MINTNKLCDYQEGRSTTIEQNETLEKTPNRARKWKKSSTTKSLDYDNFLHLISIFFVSQLEKHHPNPNSIEQQRLQLTTFCAKYKSQNTFQKSND